MGKIIDLENINTMSGLDKKITCRAILGNLKKDDIQAVMIALEDLKIYWEKAFSAETFLFEDELPELQADMDLLIGTQENHPDIRKITEENKISTETPVREGYLIDLFQHEGAHLIAVVRSNDRLGLQYGIYRLAEQYLGVRFVHPLMDVQPKDPPLPPKLHMVEKPSCPLRIHTEMSSEWETINKKSHFNDLHSWRWEDWEGNPERMRYFVAWGIKNHCNVIFFNDTMTDTNYVKSGFHDSWENKRFIVSDKLWDHLDTRGMKILVWCGPSHAFNSETSGQDICTDQGGWQKHLCPAKPAFWKKADEWIELLAPHAHRLAGIFSNWQENACGEGVTKNKNGEQLLSKGQCINCGNEDNVDKWVRHLEYLEEKRLSCGLPPIGITRTHWGVAEPDDSMVAERVVPHIPPGSLSNVACLPGANKAEKIEAWVRIMDEINHKDNGDRRIFLYREMHFICGSDIPIIPFTNINRIDDDYDVLGRYDSFVGMADSVRVYHSMGWLFALYSMRKQWHTDNEWKNWFRDYFQGVLDSKSIDNILDISAIILDVQCYEGMSSGEGGVDYYSDWCLNINRLSPDTLPEEGHLNAYGNYWYSSHKRLVKEGSKDLKGHYTSRSCKPVFERILSMQKKIETVLEKIEILKADIAAREDSQIWNELFLIPLMTTGQFLYSRLLIARSYLVYIRMRENAMNGNDTSKDSKEGKKLCQKSLAAQNEYTRLKPGFNFSYPLEIDHNTMRKLVQWWFKLGKEPELCREMDICVFLDRVETEAAIKKSLHEVKI